MLTEQRESSIKKDHHPKIDMAKLRKTHDVCVSTGEYQKDGETKKRWLKVGIAFEDEHGDPVVKMEAAPLPKMDKDGFPCVWLKFFKDTGRRTNQPQQQRAPIGEEPQHHPADEGDDVPF